MKKTILILLIISVLLGNSVYATEVLEQDTLEFPTGGYRTLVEEIDFSDLPAEEIDQSLHTEGKLFTTGTDPEDPFGEVQPTQYYGYQALLQEDRVKGTQYVSAYEAVAEAMLHQEERVTVEGKLELEEIEKIFWACHNDFPQVFYAASAYDYGYNSKKTKTIFAFSYSSSLMTAEAASALELAAEKMIKASGVRPDMTDYEKALVLHDELARHVIYDYDSLHAYEEEEKNAQTQEESSLIFQKYWKMHSAYGALVEGKAVCDGYSRAYQYLLYKVGVVAHVVAGTAGGGGHAWNLVCLDDAWYYTDLTWDDGNFLYYQFFNATEEQMTESGHTAYRDYALPVCTATAANYFTKNGGKMSNTGDLENVVKQLKEKSYARVYVTGNLANTGDIYTWYAENIRTIATRLSLTGVSYGYVGTNREYILKLYHNTIYPLLNLTVEIASTTDKDGVLIAAYYDEKDRLVDIHQRAVSIKADVLGGFKVPNSDADYQKVRYFVWSPDGKETPLYPSCKMEY